MVKNNIDISGNDSDLEGITIREAGRRGGISTRDRHGVEFYRQIGSKGGKTTKKLYGHLFKDFGRRGGRPRRTPL